MGFINDVQGLHSPQQCSTGFTVIWHAGLVLAPMTYAHEEATGIPFVPSMALGVLVTAPFLTVGLILAGQAPWNLFPKASALPGILAGCLWNGGNVSPIHAPSASI